MTPPPPHVPAPASTPASASGPSRLARLLERRDLVLPTFTADELAVVDATPTDCRLVALPTLDELDPLARRGALGAARRALRAHDLIAETGEPRGALRLVHELRTAPSRLALATRVRDEARTDVYLYGLGTVAMLDERPEPGGAHRFVLRSPRATAAALTALADPDQRAADHDGPLADPADRHEVDALLAEAESVTSMWVAARAGSGATREAALHVACGPEGVHLVTAHPNGTALVTRTVSAATLTLALQLLVTVGPSPAGD